MNRLLLALALLAAPLAAQSNRAPAPLANTQLSDPAQEARARALMLELRCLVCQGQSIADSDADMAGDMRALVRDRIRRGEEPAAIRQWLVERYGDYVTYKPPLSVSTFLLWLAPLILLALGGWIALGSFRRRQNPRPPAPSQRP